MNNKSVVQQIREAIAAERERCAQVAEWFHNVEKFTAADVAKRIRRSAGEQVP